MKGADRNRSHQSGLWSSGRHAAAALFAAGFLLAYPEGARADVEGAINAMKSEMTSAFSTLSGTVATVKNKATDTLANTEQIKKTTQDIADAKEAVEAISKNLMDFTAQGKDLVVYYTTHETAAFNSFVGSNGCAAPCTAYREKLVQLVENMQGAINALIRFQRIQQGVLPGTNLPQIPYADFSLLIEQIRNIPGFVLYPVHKGLSIANANPAIQKYGDVSMDAGAAKSSNPVLDGINGFLVQVWSLENTPETFGAIFGDCPSTMAPDVRNRLKGVAIGLKVAVPVKFIAVLLEAAGHTNVSSTQGGVAAVGHVSMRLEHNFPALLGKAWGGIADFALAVASSIDNRLYQCEVLVNQETILCMLEQQNGQGQANRTGVTLRQYCAPKPLFRP